jgi:hypothetical protein
MVPAASADERQVGAVTDLLATKTPNEIFDLVGNNSSAAPEIPGYDYMTNKLGTNISMAEYIHILDVIQNKSLQTEGADFYMAYISKPDEVFINPYINDTPRNLINKIPYYKSTVNSWDRIITSYGKMDYHDRIMYLNTIGLDSDSVVNLYKTSDINTVVYMLNQSSSTFDELNSVNINNDPWYLVGHIGEAKSKGQQLTSIMEKFNNKSVFAYNEYTYNYIDHDSVFNLNNSVVNGTLEQLNKGIVELNQTHNSVNGQAEFAKILGSTCTALGGVLIAASIVFFALGNIGAIPVLILGLIMLAIGVIMLVLFGIFTIIDGVLVDNRDLLIHYRDSLPH